MPMRSNNFTRLMEGKKMATKKKKKKTSSLLPSSLRSRDPAKEARDEKRLRARTGKAPTSSEMKAFKKKAKKKISKSKKK